MQTTRPTLVLGLLLAGLPVIRQAAGALPDAAAVGAHAQRLLAEQRIDPQEPGVARLDFEPAEGGVMQLVLTQGPGRLVLQRR